MARDSYYFVLYPTICELAENPDEVLNKKLAKISYEFYSKSTLFHDVIEGIGGLDRYVLFVHQGRPLNSTGSTGIIHFK
jgi:hypothetical protein